MKKCILPLLVCVTIAVASCGNEATRTGAVDDTARISPPTEKVQDTMSLTDTFHHIEAPKK
jgi:hypothetical protein